MLKQVANWPRSIKRPLIMVADFALLPLALWTAIGLRLDNWQAASAYSWWMFLLPSVLAIPIFVRMGLYRAIIRFMGDKAIFTIVLAVTISVLFFVGAYVFLGLPNIPRGALVIYWILANLYIGTSRFLARYVLRRIEFEAGQRRVLIYGAGSAGRQLAVGLRIGHEYDPVGFIDDDVVQHGLTINSLTVYSQEDLGAVVSKLRVTDVLLAIPSAPRKRRIDIINSLLPLHVRVQVMPGLAELAGGEVKISDIREVEIDDLLGRNPVPPDDALLAANIRGKAVMVTGAGGSIGGELCRQIIQLGPKLLVLYELSEFALYNIEHELRLMAASHKIDLQILPVMGSVQNGIRLKSIMMRYGIQTVYHAAAYKHVPLVEFNMVEGILNNTFGTRATALSAIASGVETFVLISTDKAVRPTNVMGASKRLAELVLQSLADDPSVRTQFSMVRFGNVLGSSGSVVPLFRKQIASGGPVTVTHPEIIRYFMTIPEASQLVIQAGAMGGNGEVFVLDMGEPVRIVDLARRMIQLSGFSVRDANTPDGDINIEFTGLRPGEKLYEELLIGDDVTGTPHPRIMKAHESFMSRQHLEGVLEDLANVCMDNDLDRVRQILFDNVSGYKPEREIVDLLRDARPLAAS